MKKIRSDIKRFLLSCSGEDTLILEKCNEPIKNRFELLGFFVLCIFAGCFFSATFFIYSLFEETKWISFPIGIIWGAIIVNLYLLLLHTISPPIIPLSAKNVKTKKISFLKNKFLNFSMFLRICFMLLLAIIIAQPLSVFLLSNTIKDDLDKHKIVERVKLYSLTNKDLIKNELEILKEYKRKISYTYSTQTNENIAFLTSKIQGDSLFLVNSSKKIKELKNLDDLFILNALEKSKKRSLIQNLDLLLDKELNSDAHFITNLNAISIVDKHNREFENYKLSLNNLINEKIINYNSLNNLLDKSNFYVKKIQLLLSENPLSWLVTLLVCAIFLIPIYSKYKVRDLCSKMFQEENNTADVLKLRKQLIETTDFNWLSKKIKSPEVNKIETSDYYFHRMLIEHKIILEEYDKMKSQLSIILSNHIKLYNESSRNRIMPLLYKLKENNIEQYNKYLKEINEEYIDEKVMKYEYFQDAPFRNMKPKKEAISCYNEKDFLNDIYNQPETI